LKIKQKQGIQEAQLAILREYILPGFESLLAHWLHEEDVQIRISRPRVSKLGDYRLATADRYARISINGDLHPLEFMITLGHELAHHQVYKDEGIRHKAQGGGQQVAVSFEPGAGNWQLVTGKNRRVEVLRKRRRGKNVIRPHGLEWKLAFREKISEIIGVLESLGPVEGGNVRSEVLIKALKKCYFKREGIATSICPNLHQILHGSSLENQVIRLADLPEGQRFMLRGGKKFTKGPKLRTRYRCKELKTGRFYTVHAMAEVIIFD